MNKTVWYLGIVVIVLAVISLVMGLAFIGQGLSKQTYIINAMKEEKVPLAALGVKGVDPTEIIDTAKEAEIAGNTVREHRHGIAASYKELLGTGKFDPTNPKHLTYSQAINLENYLFLGVAGLGLVTVVLASGGFMIVTALALGAIGFALLKIARA
ncbi:MAG: hypothetical protein FJ008_08430 [Chloroflexi bacterium]|nr:hypothetical protein [Chloroflexota bacterium]MBM3172687.1 hypothetical protein [Chloroflexota bacterium]MBM3175319.1 hypothetical protein [Chloroflexota bacterium]MBM4450453.1 hypothetical protein [Chloroflexota bacterium]